MEQKKTPIALELEEAIRFLPKSKLKWNNIALLYPITKRNGKEGCRVYYKDGSYDDVASSCAATLNALARQYFTTVTNAKALARQCPWVTRSRMMDIMLGETCTVVPVIAREPAADNNHRVGYLIKQELYSTQVLPDGTLVKFFEEHEGIRIAQKESTVRQKLMEATLLERHYMELMAELRRQQEQEETEGQIGQFR